MKSNQVAGLVVKSHTHVKIDGVIRDHNSENQAIPDQVEAISGEVHTKSVQLRMVKIVIVIPVGMIVRLRITFS